MVGPLKAHTSLALIVIGSQFLYHSFNYFKHTRFVLFGNSAHAVLRTGAVAPINYLCRAPAKVSPVGIPLCFLVHRRLQFRKISACLNRDFGPAEAVESWRDDGTEDVVEVVRNFPLISTSRTGWKWMGLRDILIRGTYESPQKNFRIIPQSSSFHNGTGSFIILHSRPGAASRAWI